MGARGGQFDESEHGRETDVRGVEGDEEDAEDLREGDVEDEVCLVVGYMYKVQGYLDQQPFMYIYIIYTLLVVTQWIGYATTTVPLGVVWGVWATDRHSRPEVRSSG